MQALCQCARLAHLTMPRRNVSISLAPEHETFLQEAAKDAGCPVATFIRRGALALAQQHLNRGAPEAVKLPPGRKPKSQAGQAARALGLSLRASLRAG